MSPAHHPQAGMNRQPPRAPLPQRPVMNPGVPRGVNPSGPRGPSIPKGQGARPMVRQGAPQNFVRPGHVPPNAPVASSFRAPAPAPVQYPNQNLPGRNAPLPQPSLRPQAPVSPGLPNLDSLVAQMKATLASSPSAFSRFSLSSENTLEIDDHVEMAGLLFLLVSGRPVYVHTSPPGSVQIKYLKHTIECEAVKVGSDAGLLFVSDSSKLNEIVTELSKSVPKWVEEKFAVEVVPTLEEIPSLNAETGEVLFQSFQHFVLQFTSNISKGALVVKEQVLASGTLMTLTLAIPGIEERVQVQGRVAFQGEGGLGFMLQDFSLVHEQLAQIAVRPAPSKEAQQASMSSYSSSKTAPRRTQIKYNGRISSNISIADIFEYQDNQPADIRACKEWLVKILDFLFRNGVEGVCKFSNDEKCIELWVKDGSIVFSRVTPEDEHEKIGRSLVLQKKISRSTLQAALEKSEKANQALGRTLVSMGELDSASLNNSLRQQVTKRVFDLALWQEGQLDISIWSEPPVQASLVSTNGSTMIVSLLREAVRREHLGEIEEFVESYLDRVFEVQINQNEATSGLKKKERRFFEKAAGVNVNLRDLAKATAFTANETFRYVILGRALGIMAIGKSALKKTDAERTKDLLLLIKEKLSTMTAGSYFEVLGLHWTCTDREIEPAYKKKKLEFAKYSENSERQIQLNAKKGIELLDNANEVLSSPGKRKKYRDEKVSENERKQASSAMLDQVQLLLVKDDVVQAQILLKTAQEIYPTSRAERLYSDIRDGSYKVDL